MQKIQPRPYLLINKIQHYDWGMRGEQAFIPRFLGRETSGNKKPYAELWIGAHPKAPSDVVMNGEHVPLPDLIAGHPFEILGRSVVDIFKGTFPFLFKIVSVAEPLSIQAHPDKVQAQSLHDKDPENYPDDNHKPEIAIALDSFHALLGFRRISEIIGHFGKHPELATFIHLSDLRESLKTKKLTHTKEEEVLKTLVTSIVERSKQNHDQLVRVIDTIYERLRQVPEPLSEEEILFLKLKEKYPEDVGLLFLFLLRKVDMGKGQGFFVKPGTPHAYLRGNVVECMASSDNVVRAGLTRKHVDSVTLIDILDYDLTPAPIIEGDQDGDEFEYQTPATEFRVSTLRLDRSKPKLIRTGKGPMVFLVMEGSIMVQWNEGGDPQREVFSKGQAILIPALLDELKILSLDSVKIFKVDVPIEKF
jgi:mannose-6-phosphate isomerase